LKDHNQETTNMNNIYVTSFLLRFNASVRCVYLF